MSKGLKILAIVVLLATVAGAGAVLYGINTLTPAVEAVRVDAVPAAQAQEAFDTIVRQIEDGTFAGRVYGGAENAANLARGGMHVCDVHGALCQPRLLPGGVDFSYGHSRRRHGGARPAG